MIKKLQKQQQPADGFAPGSTGLCPKIQLWNSQPQDVMLMATSIECFKRRLDYFMELKLSILSVHFISGQGGSIHMQSMGIHIQIPDAGIWNKE